MSQKREVIRIIYVKMYSVFLNLQIFEWLSCSKKIIIQKKHKGNILLILYTLISSVCCCTTQTKVYIFPTILRRSPFDFGHWFYSLTLWQLNWKMAFSFNFFFISADCLQGWVVPLGPRSWEEEVEIWQGNMWHCCLPPIMIGGCGWYGSLWWMTNLSEAVVA